MRRTAAARKLMASLGLHYEKKVQEEIAIEEGIEARRKKQTQRLHTFGFDGWPITVHPV
jgi:hypothetical protein